MSEEVLKVEKSRTGTGSNGLVTVSVFSYLYAKPGDITVAATSSTGYERCVFVGEPTPFVSDTSVSGYKWRATFPVAVDNIGSWPVGVVNPVVVLSVYSAGGVFIGTVEVTLVATGIYMVAPSSITFLNPEYS
jgi:hypothetical protein